MKILKSTVFSLLIAISFVLTHNAQADDPSVLQWKIEKTILLADPDPASLDLMSSKPSHLWGEYLIVNFNPCQYFVFNSIDGSLQGRLDLRPSQVSADDDIQMIGIRGTKLWFVHPSTGNFGTIDLAQFSATRPILSLNDFQGVSILFRDTGTEKVKSHSFEMRRQNDVLMWTTLDNGTDVDTLELWLGVLSDQGVKYEKTLHLMEKAWGFKSMSNSALQESLIYWPGQAVSSAVLRQGSSDLTMIDNGPIFGDGGSFSPSGKYFAAPGTWYWQYRQLVVDIQNAKILTAAEVGTSPKEICGSPLPEITRWFVTDQKLFVDYDCLDLGYMDYDFHSMTYHYSATNNSTQKPLIDDEYVGMLVDGSFAVYSEINDKLLYPLSDPLANVLLYGSTCDPDQKYYVDYKTSRLLIATKGSPAAAVNCSKIGY